MYGKVKEKVWTCFLVQYLQSLMRTVSYRAVQCLWLLVSL